jgi:hypothetical protein
MNKAKFKMWWTENWLRICIGLVVVICIIATVAGAWVFMFQLESFQKQSLLASFPIYLINGVATTLLFLFGYTFMLSGRFTKMASETKKMKVEHLQIKFSDVIGLEAGSARSRGPHQRPRPHQKNRRENHQRNIDARSPRLWKNTFG